MNLINWVKNWLGQVTTGHGFMIIASTLLSVLSGGITWAVAAPLLVAGVLGLFWPENLALQSTSRVAAGDMVKMVASLASKAAPEPHP